MTEKEWQRISDLFNRARALEPSLREQFLEDTCKDTELRAVVESLLKVDERLGDSSVDPDLDGLIKSLGRTDHTSKHGSAPGSSDADVPGRYIGLELNRGRYILEKELGSGATSTVYLASDRDLPDKRCVVKILKKGFVDHEWFRKKFEQEKTVLSRLDGHARIVAVTDSGEFEGQPYFVMPYADGTTLKSEIKKGPMDFLRVAQIVCQIGDALDFAHTKFIYHLDLKPGNIVLQNPDSGKVSVRIIDFGIAKIKSPNPGPRSEASRIAGTIGYMAPDQYQGLPSGSSDIYALGVIAFEMLTGRFPTEHDLLQLDLVRTKDQTGELNDDLSEGTQRVIARALAREPTQRHPNATAFGEDFERSLVADQGWKALRWVGVFLSRLGPRIPLTAVLALVLLTLTGTLLIARFIIGGTSRIVVASSPFEDLREDYKSGVGEMRGNLSLQFIFVVIGLYLAFHPRTTISFPALGVTLPATWLYFLVPIVLMFLWLQFGFLLDDLIKWRAEAWRILLETGSTVRASGFRDGGYMDAWFMCFRPREHNINMTWVLGSALFLWSFCCPLFAANYACTVILLLIGAQRRLPTTEPTRLEKVSIRCLPWFAVALICLSHLQFRFGGPNPNWMQPLTVTVSTILGYFLYRSSRRKMRGTVEENSLAGENSREVQR